MSIKFSFSNTILILFVFNFYYIGVKSALFDFSMDPYSKTCFGEFINENITSIIKINTSKLKLKYRLINPDGETIDSNDNKIEYKTVFYPKSSGIHQICFENYSSENNENISISINIGVAAKDYNSIAKFENLKPVEKYLIQLRDKLELLINEFSNIFISDLNDKNENQEKIGKSIIYGSVFIVIFMLVVNFIEFSIIKNYIEYRRRI